MSDSGYKSCACRDCMEIAIGDEGERALCHHCENNGCSPDGDAECQADHAYCGAEAEVDEVWVGGTPFCTACGQAL